MHNILLRLVRFSAGCARTWEQLCSPGLFMRSVVLIFMFQRDGDGRQRVFPRVLFMSRTCVECPGSERRRYVSVVIVWYDCRIWHDRCFSPHGTLRRKLPRAHTMHASDASVQLRNAIASKHCATLIKHYSFLVASVAIHVCSGSVFDVAIKYCRALQSVQNRIKISANLTPPLRRRILNGERGFMTDRNWRQEW
jgi:hypothetical protein